MKNLLLSMNNMQTRDFHQSHFKPIEFFNVSNAHRNLFENYGLDLSHVQQSNIIYNNYHPSLNNSF